MAMTRTRVTRRLTVLAALAALAALAYVAASLSQPVEREPAPTHPIVLTSAAVRAADRSTATPNFSRMADGLYGKQIVQTASAKDDYTIQVWALLVSPHATTGDARLPGAAVLIVEAGTVELIQGGNKTRLNAGAVAAVAEDSPLRLVNTDETRPAHLRAVVLSGTR
jgi:quercetin dioxygenase-like cupin family protein